RSRQQSRPHSAAFASTSERRRRPGCSPVAATPAGSQPVATRAASRRLWSSGGLPRTPLWESPEALKMDHAFGSSEPFTLGIEEELLLVDPETRRLAPVAADVLNGMD